MIYTKEEKLRVVKLYLNGVIEYPPDATHHQRENIRKRIKEWVGLYKAQGEQGLEPKNHEYTFETKKKAVQMILDGHSTYQTMFQLGIKDRKRIRIWMKKYQEEGWNGLKIDKNATKYFKTGYRGTKRTKALEDEIVSLKKQIRLLEAEIDYLKKVQALIQK